MRKLWRKLIYVWLNHTNMTSLFPDVITTTFWCTLYLAGRRLLMSKLWQNVHLSCLVTRCLGASRIAVFWVFWSILARKHSQAFSSILWPAVHYLLCKVICVLCQHQDICPDEGEAQAWQDSESNERVKLLPKTCWWIILGSARETESENDQYPSHVIFIFDWGTWLKHIKITISHGIFEWLDLPSWSSMLRGFQRISGALRYEAALVVRIAIRFGSSSVCASTSKYQIELVFISPFLVADDRGLYCYTSKYIGDWVLNTAQLVYQLQHQHLIVERLDNTFWLGHLGSCGRLIISSSSWWLENSGLDQDCWSTR